MEINTTIDIAKALPETNFISFENLVPVSKKVNYGVLEETPETIGELQEMIVRNLNCGKCQKNNQTNVLNALKKLSQKYGFSVEHIRYLLLSEKFGKHKEAIRFLHTKFGKRKVKKQMKRFKRLLKKNKIDTDLRLQSYNRMDSREGKIYCSDRLINFIEI